MDNFYKGCPAKMEDGRHLTDYRSANAREQYIKTMNGFYRDDDYRIHLQENANKFMDTEWNFMSTQQACKPTCCVHRNPMTRTTTGANFNELALYNAVRSGKIGPSNSQYPSCDNLMDYRLSKY